MTQYNPGSENESSSEAQKGAGEAVSFYKAASGIKSWLVTLDHKRIGVMYLVFVLAAFLLGGVFALLVRTEPLAEIMCAWPYLVRERSETCTLPWPSTLMQAARLRHTPRTRVSIRCISSVLSSAICSGG